MSARHCFAATAIVVAALASASPAAQQTFRTSANTIAVEATVIDKSGQPVTDLTPADFHILEDGKPQPVQTIYLVAAPGTRAPSTSAPAHLGTSAPVEVKTQSRVMIFVFDLNHLSADGYKRSKAAVESFLKSGALPTDLLGIVAGGTMLNNRIDSDKAALLNAMASMKGPNQARYNELRSFPRLVDDFEGLAIARGHRETVDRATRRACSERPSECSGPGGDEVVRQQVEAKAREFTAQALRDAQLSLNAMATLANGLGRFPGRKQVVVFSDGFLTAELESQLKAVVELAAKNNVRFSTIDSRGLNRDPRAQNFMGEQPLTAPGDMAPMGLDNNTDALSSIAIDTGGEFLMNRNDLRPALDIVSTNSSTFYVLGYAPEKAMDGSYRKIEVRVSRPGVTVFARKGYVATASAARLPVAAAEASLAANPVSVPVPTPNATTSMPDTTAAPKARPNSEKNVEALAKISPSGTSASSALAAAGWDAYAKGDVAAARESLANAVAAGNTAPWVSYALGFSEYALGHYQAAVTAWESVRAAAPEFMPVYFDLADAHFSLGRSADALAILRDAARRWPLEPEAQNALGATLVRRGALDDAIDVFAKITGAKPTDSLGFFNLGRAYHLRYLRLQQNIASARLSAANAIGEDDRKKAIAAYTQYLSIGGPFEKEAREAIAALEWRRAMCDVNMADVAM